MATKKRLNEPKRKNKNPHHRRTDGAGKITFAGEFLPNEADCPIFVNADLIAAGFAPFDPDRAAIKTGHLMLKDIYYHVLSHESFAFY